MNKLPNMVIIEESIGDGFINENGKKVVSTKTKTYSRSKEWAEKNSGDETLKVLGDAYEVFSVIQGRKVRQIVTIERAEQIESKKSIQPTIFLEPKSEDDSEVELEDELEDKEDSEGDKPFEVETTEELLDEEIQEVQIVEEIEKPEEEIIEAEKSIERAKRGRKKA